MIFILALYKKESVLWCVNNTQEPGQKIAQFGCLEIFPTAVRPDGDSQGGDVISKERANGERVFIVGVGYFASSLIDVWARVGVGWESLSDLRSS